MNERKRVIDLTWRMARRSISSEFKGTALGRAWSFINPLATIAVFSVIFGLVFRGGVEPGKNSGIDAFALWIGVGIIAWNFISNSVMRSLVYSAVLALVYDFAFELTVLLVIMLIAGGPTVLLFIPQLIAITVLAAVFTTGLGMMLAIASVYFRDISHLWQIFNQVWMYASGVVFPLSMLDQLQNRLFNQGWQINGHPLPLTTTFRMNPAELFLEAYRSCLYDFANPSLGVWLGCLGWAVLSFAVGRWVFSRYSARIVEEL